MTSHSIKQMVCRSRVESRILLYTARRELSAAEQDRLSGLLGNQIDWNYLCESATRQGSMPLLFRQLNSLAGSAVPGRELRILGRHFVSNAVRSRKLSEVMFRILRAFAREGIVGVPYKGPALAAVAYGDLTLRISGDLDILILPQDIHKAKQLLLEGDFGLREKHDSRNHFSIKELYHLEFLGHGGNPPVELHWRFSDDLDLAVDLSEWFQRLHNQEIAGQQVRVLAPEETLISLCIHGTKDLWNRLILVADVSELIRSQPDMSWRRVLELAGTPDALRMLSICLLLVRDLMEVDLPANICAIIDSDQAAKTLAQRIAKRLLRGLTTVVRPPERIPFALAVRRKPRQRIQYISSYLRILFTPDELDLAYIYLGFPI